MKIQSFCVRQSGVLTQAVTTIAENIFRSQQTVAALSVYHSCLHALTKIDQFPYVCCYSKTSAKICFQDQTSQVKSIAECSKRSFQKYFLPSLSYHLSLRTLFCLFLSGRFTQVLSYDVASGSEIRQCTKICKPLVVYPFTGNVITSITRLRT